MTSVLEYSWSQLPNFIQYDRNTSKLSLALRQGWQRARAAGAFRYNAEKLPTRRVLGAHSYLLQLNPARASKRRVAAQIQHIRQDFNPEAFNFTHVQPSEVVLRLKSRHRGEETHTVLVNVSPISDLHSLLCPNLDLCQPQVITEDSLTLAVEFYFLAADRDLRIGFNSLCALASVNHLHYHLLVESASLPVEQAKSCHLVGPLYCLEDYPVQAFCFQVEAKQHIIQTCRDAYKLCEYFLKHDIAHNLIITRGQSLERDDQEVLRIVIWPRKSSYGAKQFDAFNVALCELSGWFPIFDEEYFKCSESPDIENELRSWRIDTFDEVRQAVKCMYM